MPPPTDVTVAWFGPEFVDPVANSGGWPISICWFQDAVWAFYFGDDNLKVTRVDAGSLTEYDVSPSGYTDNAYLGEIRTDGTDLWVCWGRTDSDTGGDEMVVSVFDSGSFTELGTVEPTSTPVTGGRYGSIDPHGCASPNDPGVFYAFWAERGAKIEDPTGGYRTRVVASKWDTTSKLWENDSLLYEDNVNPATAPAGTTNYVSQHRDWSAAANDSGSPVFFYALPVAFAVGQNVPSPGYQNLVTMYDVNPSTGAFTSLQTLVPADLPFAVSNPDSLEGLGEVPPKWSGSGLGAERGAVVHAMWDSDYIPAAAYYDDSLRSDTFALFGNGNLQWARVDIGWTFLWSGGAPANPTGYDVLDSIIDYAEANAMSVLLNLYIDNGTTPDPDDFAAFAGDLAARYAGRAVAYEIANEPNWPTGWPGTVAGSANTYVTLLAAAYATIKTADPATTVVTGGLAGVDLDYAQDMYDEGALGNFDAFGVHPYSALPDSADGIPKIPDLHSLMVANGDTRPIWVTEFGWNALTEVSEATQAAYATDSLALLAAFPYVPVVIWYDDRDNPDDDNGWGLLRDDFSQRPVFAAMTAGSPSLGVDVYVTRSSWTSDAGSQMAFMQVPCDGSADFSFLDGDAATATAGSVNSYPWHSGSIADDNSFYWINFSDPTFYWKTGSHDFGTGIPTDVFFYGAQSYEMVENAGIFYAVSVTDTDLHRTRIVAFSPVVPAAGPFAIFAQAGSGIKTAAGTSGNFDPATMIGILFPPEDVGGIGS